MVLQPFVHLAVTGRREARERRILLLQSLPTPRQARVPIVAYGESKLAEANLGNRRLLLEGEVRLLPPLRT